MTVATTAARQPATKRMSGLRPGVPVHLHGVTWDDYTALTELFAERRLRTYFCDGEMEVLMPSALHELWIALIGRLLDVLTEELEIPCRCMGSLTCRREDLEKGLEPDRCFYLTNEATICGKDQLEMGVDPPPDLALEVEITSSAEKRMQVYAALGVPEVWRFDGEELRICQLLPNSEYVVVEWSRYFPNVSLHEMIRYCQKRNPLNDTAIAKSFRKWVREQIAAGWPNNAK